MVTSYFDSLIVDGFANSTDVSRVLWTEHQVVQKNSLQVKSIEKTARNSSLSTLLKISIRRS